MQPYMDLSPIVEPLLAWYDHNKRPLPWRNDPSPYHVWISEIMLQQTRIEAVIPYYERFLSVCPTAEALAAIDDEALMKLWEGLGYYSRARNLKRAAQVIVERYNGMLPADYAELLSLPGVGPYTAGAIASIAYGLPEPAVDGNVLRVIARLTADESDVTRDETKKRITAALRQIYPQTPKDAAAMTQAVMELGERICLPNGAPKCDQCPLGAFCPARAQGLTERIPYRSPKKARKIQQKTVFLLVDGDKVALRKRKEKGLLAGLWEFVNEDGYMEEREAASRLAAREIEFGELVPVPEAVHVFTHVEWHMKGYLVLCPRMPSSAWDGETVWATAQELSTVYALPTAFRAHLRALTDFWSGET